MIVGPSHVSAKDKALKTFRIADFYLAGTIINGYRIKENGWAIVLVKNVSKYSMPKDWKTKFQVVEENVSINDVDKKLMWRGRDE